MGGGIAYQAAVKGLPIVMKDIREEALALGMTEAGKLLAKQVERGKSTPEKMSQTLGRIRPTLTYGDFGTVDIIIEAVVENPKVKKSVFAEVEPLVREDTIIASNTSTISISYLAEGLQRPQNFVGMHFFNPVHMMPLVEVIRGTAVVGRSGGHHGQACGRMGKTPIVVNDCPGFFVNRVLFPYFDGFQRPDARRRGFPGHRQGHGKVRLADGAGLPDGRRGHGHWRARRGRHGRGLSGSHEARLEERDAGARRTQALRRRRRGKGYYAYVPDKKGKPKKTVDPTTYELIAPVVGPRKEFTPEDIVGRCMVPMVNEVARCLEEKIVASPYEADMALLYGIGFPPFRGGACRYVDQMGVAQLRRAVRQVRLARQGLRGAATAARHGCRQQEIFPGLTTSPHAPNTGESR